ncbi:ABC transporter permease, partial [mine drainage metagenome]
SGEIGVRRALGASRRAIFAQLLIEAGMIGAAGALLGLLLTWLGLWLVRRQPSDYASLAHLEPAMLVATLALALSPACRRAAAGVARVPDPARAATQIHVRPAMMTPRPILSSLRRHKIAAFLIVLEIALAFAIVSNAVYLVIGRLQRVDLPSGIDERNLVLLRLATAGKQHGSVTSAQTDLAALRAIPGVESASAINTLPLSSSQWSLAYSLRPMRAFSDGVQVPVFFGGPELLQTLGI